MISNMFANIFPRKEPNAQICFIFIRSAISILQNDKTQCNRCLLNPSYFPVSIKKVSYQKNEYTPNFYQFLFAPLQFFSVHSPYIINFHKKAYKTNMGKSN